VNPELICAFIICLYLLKKVKGGFHQSPFFIIAVLLFLSLLISSSEKDTKA